MKKILFMGNHFVALYSYRKELITRLANEGYELYLSIPDSEDNQFFIDLGCKVIPTEIDRRGANPFKDWKLIRFYKKMIAEVDPDIIFSYTIKPNIYGTLVSNGKYKHVCNITGTGGTFLKKSLIGEIVKFLYKISVKKCYKVFFQNTGDRDFFIQNRLVSDNYAMLPGSGCNLEQHAFKPMPEDDVIRFIFIGRVMKLKGIDEYLAAAEMIKKKYPNTEFLIAGWNEEEEYAKVVRQYEENGIVKYIGFRKDIDEWMERCHCTVLPSHGGEGVPNVLLESSATGRVCIASRIHGSSDVVDDGVTGYLFTPGDAQELAEKMECFLALSAEERAEMGVRGREKMEREFDRNIVIDAYLAEVYEETERELASAISET